MLGKIGAGIAAPFTGGASLAAIPMIDALGQVAGGAAGGAANQRQHENALINQRNSLLAQLFNTQQGATTAALQGQERGALDRAGLDLQRRQFALNAPQTRGTQAMRGSLMANLQPTRLSGLPSRISASMPQVSGGLNASALSPEVREMGRTLQRQALLDQMKGDTFDPVPETDFKSGVLPLPALEELKKSGLLEKILGGVGLGASIVGGMGGAAQTGPRLQNQFPTPQAGRDMYGNPADWRLPRGVLGERT